MICLNDPKTTHTAMAASSGGGGHRRQVLGPRSRDAAEQLMREAQTPAQLRKLTLTLTLTANPHPNP